MIFEHGWISSSLIFWGAIVLFVLIGSYFRYRTRASEHRMLEKLAESGQSLTPELLARLGNGHGDRRSSNPLKGGIFLMCIGIAIAVFFWAMGGGGNLFQGGGYVPNWLPVLGIFPFMVGLARFLGGLTDRRRNE